ncbi:MAG: hypothetical protein AAF715_31620 [Myxococcota bacterium]
MPQIPIAGVGSDFLIPGQYAQLRVAQGPSTASAGAREVVFVMPKLASGGAWEANSEYRVRGEQDAIDGAGEGSLMHIAIREFLRHNQGARIFAVPYLPTSGTGANAANLDVTITFPTDSNPTAAGTAIIYVGGEACTYTYTAADTATTIAAALAGAVNARAWLPVGASAAAGVVTLTAKTAGIAGGDGTIPAHRIRLEVSANTNVTFQSENSLTTDFLGGGAGQSGTDGTTAEATNFAAALATLDSTRRYYMVSSTFLADSVDEGWDLLRAHIANKSAPRVGLRSMGVVGHVGTLAEVTADAVTMNDARMRVAWQKGSDKHPAQLAAALAGILQAGHDLSPRFNFDGFRGRSQRIPNNWAIPAAPANADWPDQDDLNEAIADGVTVIQSDDLGSYIVRAVGTRSKDGTGANNDFRALDDHIVSVGDYMLDRLLIRWALDFAELSLANDTFLADGVTVDVNAQIGPDTVTPFSARPWFVRQLNELGPDGEGHLQRIDETTGGLDVVIDPVTKGRLEVGFTWFATDQLHQMTLRADEAS